MSLDQEVVDETFLSHFTSKECQTKFKKLSPSVEEIEKMVKKRHPVCKNRKTQSGHDIGLFAPQDITKYKEDGDMWCFTNGDRLFVWDPIHKRMDPKNPFTGKDIDREAALDIEKHERVPMLTEYIYPVCPIFRSQNPLVRFVMKSKRGDYVTKGSAMATNPSSIYRGILKKDWKPSAWSGEKDIGIYDADQFQELKQVYDPLEQLRDIERTKGIPDIGRYSLGVKKDADLSRYFQKPKYSGLGMYAALKTYMSHPDFYVTKDLAKDLQALKIRLSTPVRVYRGLSLSNKIWNKLEVDETVKLKDIYAASSWTTEICIAAGFGSEGVVLEYLAQPDEVVIDTRLLKPEVLTSLYETIQYEVMLDQRDRDVKVKLIIHSGQPVASYKHTEIGANNGSESDSESESDDD